MSDCVDELSRRGAVEMRCGRLERDADENEDRIGRVSNGIYTEMIPRDGTQAE